MNFRFSEFEMYSECLEIWKKLHDSVWQVLDLLMREFYCEQILRAQNSVVPTNKKGKEVVEGSRWFSDSQRVLHFSHCFSNLT